MTLMVMAGLNDYQLKGKAEVVYWPPLVDRLEKSKVPESPSELAVLLKPFYLKERMPDQKANRLYRFLQSSLAERLWRMTSAEAASKVTSLCREIADTMGQPPQKKTIAFSAKMLALALILLGETGFDFSGIPVPVDSRLRKLTPGLDEEHIQLFWDAVLDRLRKVDDRLTQVHLDSFLWRYAGADNNHAYLQEMGVSKSAAEQITRAFSTLRRLRA